MTAPTELRPEADVVQDALAAADLKFRELFGRADGWSQTVLSAYWVDQHTARQRATNWESAA